MERVISEFRLVETDDGYRLEVKGDREAIRRAMGGFHMHHAHRGHAFMPFAFAGHGPWCHWQHGCCESGGGEEQAEEPKQGE